MTLEDCHEEIFRLRRQLTQANLKIAKYFEKYCQRLMDCQAKREELSMELDLLKKALDTQK